MISFSEREWEDGEYPFAAEVLVKKGSQASLRSIRFFQNCFDISDLDQWRDLFDHETNLFAVWESLTEYGDKFDYDPFGVNGLIVIDMLHVKTSSRGKKLGYKLIDHLRSHYVGLTMLVVLKAFPVGEDRIDDTTGLIRYYQQYGGLTPVGPRNSGLFMEIWE